jgi:hypothetical protein
MELEVYDNPNCRGSGQLVFNDQEEAPRRVTGMVVTTPTGDAVCDVTGVGDGGMFCPAFAVKVNDSGEGTAFLIYGGSWGLRFRRKTDAARSWDLQDTLQWGESYKVYGSAEDIIF